ncbi:DUF748 domain-containing protein [Desulfobotulus mexicanus]|uniref:DUF748 domain-containing protein n=1 Tax=Desulfobotulus mexicanus TaxID=2586642 RepID=A0A5Q4VE10_9BACT|nr:DUF748 domain-containing protein [Desulfobotulus mexicanus]TYT75924.1 DUF748 domain-containing protein [Desulfobotulus mexicanus]
MKRVIRNTLIVTASCIVLWFPAVFFGLSMALTHMVPDRLSQLLGRTVSIEQIRVNPFTLSVTVREFEIREKDGKDSFVSFERFYVNAEILSLIQRSLILKAVELEKPEIHLARFSDMTFNFSDIIEGIQSASPADAEAEKTDSEEPFSPFNFTVQDIRIVDGSIEYRDLPADKTHRLDPINWHLPLISNTEHHRDSFSEPALSFALDGAQISVNVWTKPFKDTMETLVELGVSGLSLPMYASYLPEDQVRFMLEKGTLDLTGQVSFRMEENPVVEVQGDLILSDIHVMDKAGEDIFMLPRLELSLNPSPVLENRLHIDTLLIQSPGLFVQRREDGSISLNDLIPAPVDAADTSIPEKMVAEDEKNKEISDESGFWVEVDTFILDDGRLQFRDFSVQAGGRKPTQSSVLTDIYPLRLTVSPFTTVPDHASVFDFSAGLNGSAQLVIKGEVQLTPLSLTSDLVLSDFALIWLQPYLPENIQLVIREGLASAGARIAFALEENSDFSLSLESDTAILAFSSEDALEGNSFLGWDAFTVKGIRVDMHPLRVDVDEIAFKGMYASLAVLEDGGMNLDNIFIREEQDHEEEAAVKKENSDESGDPVFIRIGAFVMDDSDFRFTDRSVLPHYDTRLNLGNLRITGLTSEDFRAADVHAKGVIDGYAPLKITGSMNPLSENLFVNLDFSLGNLEMVPFSPYTGKFIGRAIEKGKLNLDVKYHIENQNITADNHLLLDQFTLGRRVPGPDAMNLPVGLAISLLKDRHGKIEIDLPVSGRTDDPEFAWGKLVLRTLQNLIVRAAASPFSLVASLVGGGEEMQFIEFEPGTADLDETAHGKLLSIRTLLYERPGLRMEILGYADEKNDTRALAKQNLERRIRMRASADGVISDEGDMNAETRHDYLKILYQDAMAVRSQESTSSGEEAGIELSLEEMEEELMKDVNIRNADLYSLAMERAAAVRAYVLKDEKIEAQRVFFREASRPLKTGDDAARAGRVELGLQ